MRMATVCSHRLVVPDNVADWDAVAGDSPWERERMESILSTLQDGDCLYDIGAEHGWMTAIYAQRVGGENMVVVEPSPEFWPNIRLCFEQNQLGQPLFCWEGFAGAEEINLTGSGAYKNRWPKSSQGPETHDRMPYRHPNHHSELIPTTTIDRIARTIRPPDGITIDVEGAELLVLEGAKYTLEMDRPYVWCSVHPDLMLKDFDTDEDLLHRFMQDQGYDGRLLRHDHEYHWGYWPSELAPL
jgi:FkbM family methyltransferase